MAALIPRSTLSDAGFANLDLFRRASEAANAVIGEASLHQDHGGVTTNVDDAAKHSRQRRSPSTLGRIAMAGTRSASCCCCSWRRVAPCRQSAGDLRPLRHLWLPSDRAGGRSGTALAGLTAVLGSGRHRVCDGRQPPAPAHPLRTRTAPSIRYGGTGHGHPALRGGRRSCRPTTGIVRPGSLPNPCER